MRDKDYIQYVAMERLENRRAFICCSATIVQLWRAALTEGHDVSSILLEDNAGGCSRGKYSADGGIYLT